MRALFYLIRKRLKNTLVAMVKNPGQLILILIIAGMLVFSISTAGSADHVNPEEYRNPIELYAIVFAFYALIFVLSIMPGFKTGASFFSLADVNMVFGAPISSKRILIYGLTRQLGMSLLAGFFILYQYAWMRMSYGITGWTLGTMLIGYGLVMFCGQIVSMLVYSRTSGDERKQSRAKNLAAILGIALAIYLLFPAISASGSGLDFNRILTSITESINRPIVNFIPILGWMKAIVQGVFEGNILMLAAGVAATVAFILLFIWIVGLVDSDYYEDILVATEISHSAITSKKEGRMKEAVPQNVKVGAEGLNHGQGASAFYYKHNLENRRARKFIFDTSTFVFVISSLIFAFIMRNMGGSIAGVAFSIYMMLFASFMGRWAKEMLLPYVYMVPQSPFRKLVMILGETIKKNFVVSVVLGIGIGLITGAGVFESITIVLVHFASSMLFISANMLAERLFGGLTIRWMQLTFLIFTILILLAPGITLGVIAGIGAGSFAVGYLAAAACNFGLSILILFLCRNILAIAELNNQ